MTGERNDLNRLKRETIGNWRGNGAASKPRRSASDMASITLALVCILLGVAIAVGLTLLGPIL
jgi:hypothetical protein